MPQPSNACTGTTSAILSRTTRISTENVGYGGLPRSKQTEGSDDRISTVILNPVIERLIQRGELFKIELPLETVIKEMDAAKDDLQDATDSFEESKWKWATIQATTACCTAATPYSTVGATKNTTTTPW